MRAALPGLCAVSAVLAACVTMGGSPAYYAAPQREIADATVRAFEQAQMPVRQVSDYMVSTASFDVGSIWTSGEIRERLSCGPLYPASRVTSVTLDVRANINAETQSQPQGARRTSTTDTRIFSETAVRVSGKGEMVVDGKKRRCALTPQFSEMLLTQVGMHAGAEPRRERDRTPVNAVPGRTFTPIGRAP